MYTIYAKTIRLKMILNQLVLEFYISVSVNKYTSSVWQTRWMALVPSCLCIRKIMPYLLNS